jgi:hypothetical protein
MKIRLATFVTAVTLTAAWGLLRTSRPRLLSRN